MNEIYKQSIKLKAFEASIKQKSPVLCAALGFFFPMIGALYTGNYLMAIVFLVLDLVFGLMWFIGIGVTLSILFHFAAAFVCYSGARRQNANNYIKAAESLP